MQGRTLPSRPFPYTTLFRSDCSTGGSVNKVVTLNADGSVPASATVGPLAAGSSSFQAAYSGDANYAGSAGPCQPVSVTQPGTSTAATVTDASTSAPWDGTETAG